MCTLIALHRTVPGAALAVAGNRDEFYARRAEGPRLRSTPAGEIVAPLDLEAGGTWFGLGAGGVFAALTNVACAPGPDPQRRSRGEVVMDALTAGSARQAIEKLACQPGAGANPFNLYVADAREAFALSWCDGPRHRQELSGGACVIGNAPLGEPPPFKIQRLADELAAAGGSAGDLEPLAARCRSHAPGPRGPLDAICVHTPSYGTRSSFLLRLAEGGPGDSRSTFLFADGAPCETVYEDRSLLLRDLGQRGPGVRGDLL